MGFIEKKYILGALNTALLVLLIPVACYRYLWPHRFNVNFILVLVEFVAYTGLLAYALTIWSVKRYIPLYFYPFLINLISILHFSVAFIARAIRFKYVSSTLPNNGQEFYNRFKYYLPDPHYTPTLTEHEWLYLARMSLICLCLRKRILKLDIHRLIAFADLQRYLLYNDISWLKYPVFVKFIGENAVDTGGLKNELFTLISQTFFELKPAYQKKIRQKHDNVTLSQFIDLIYSQIYDPTQALQMNESGALIISQNIAPAHAFMLGWLLGKCLYHNCVIPYSISDLLLAMALNHFEIKDIADYDEDYARFIQKSEYKDLEYSTFVDLLGEPKLDKRKPRKINLRSAVILKYFPLSDKPLRQLQKGFYSAFPEPASYFLTVQLLKTIIYYKEIDVDDWELHTDIGDFPANCQTPQLFFQMLRYRPALKVPILQFSTGLKNLPNGSFQWVGRPLFSGENVYKFKIDPIGAKYLPIASTCTYYLRIPVVDTISELEDKFKLALQCQALDNP